MAERRHGTVTFVGVLFLLAAAWNILFGLGALVIEGNAIDKTDPWNKDAWGVILTAVGGLQAIAAIGVLMRSAWGRILGLALASVGAFFNLFYYQANEGWAFTLLVVEIAIIYILAVHGREFS
jgi:hypothetical protein